VDGTVLIGVDIARDLSSAGRVDLAARRGARRQAPLALAAEAAAAPNGKYLIVFGLHGGPESRAVSAAARSAAVLIDPHDVNLNRCVPY